MDGHAEIAPGTGGLDELASFLTDDTPEGTVEDKGEKRKAQAPTGDEADTDADEQTLSDEATEDDEADETVDDDSEPEQEAGRKIKVTTKGDDGIESTVEVEEQELVKGYQRQSDYTRKTQELASREHEAVEMLSAKFQEIQGEYLQRIDQTRQAVLSMAGLKTAQEMAQLAQTDPAGWVAEKQRHEAIGAYLSQLDEQAKAEDSKRTTAQTHAMEDRKKAAFQRTWSELEKAKIDKPALGKIYGEVSKSYGFTPAELGEVLDHRIVMMMRDAAAYKALQAKRPEVTKKAEDAPRLPTKQTRTQNERASRDLDQKFKSGRAKLADLAAYLQ